MPGSNAKLTQAVQAYFQHLNIIRASGGATGELSSYLRLSIPHGRIGAFA